MLIEFDRPGLTCGPFWEGRINTCLVNISADVAYQVEEAIRRIGGKPKYWRLEGAWRLHFVVPARTLLPYPLFVFREGVWRRGYQCSFCGALLDEPAKSSSCSGNPARHGVLLRDE